LKNITLRIFKFILFLALGVVLLYLSFRGVNFSSFLECIKHANYLWVALALFLSWLAFYSRAHRWNLLIEHIAERPKLSESYRALIVGYFANYAFPRLGEVTRCAMLTKTNKIPINKLIGTVIAERLIDFISLLVLIVITVIVRFDTFGNFLYNQVWVSFSAKLAKSGQTLQPYIIGLIIFTLIIAGLIWLLRHKIAHSLVYQKVKGFVEGLLEGVKTVIHLQRRKEFLLHTVIIWTLYWLMSWVVVFALPSTASLDAADGLFILVIGSLGMTVPVQGGFGAFHGIVSLGLTIYGIPREQGLAYAVLAHESQVVFIIILGSMALINIFLLKPKQKVKL
jgi:uncharacterized protein (TIRG00374 family)